MQGGIRDTRALDAQNGQIILGQQFRKLEFTLCIAGDNLRAGDAKTLRWKA